jgi:(2Fe-2S) ferredoxin
LSGCLDQCAFGPVVVVYPDNVWYGRVTVADVDEIIERHIRRGEVVDRLVIPDDKLTGIAPAP